MNTVKTFREEITGIFSEIERIPIEKISEQHAKPGLYFLFGAQKRILYVGKSYNIRARVESHVQATGYKPKFKKGKIKYFGVLLGWEFLDLESVFIRTLRPRNNVTHNKIYCQKCNRWKPYKKYLVHKCKNKEIFNLLPRFIEKPENVEEPEKELEFSEEEEFIEEEENLEELEKRPELPVLIPCGPIKRQAIALREYILSKEDQKIE